MDFWWMIEMFIFVKMDYFKSKNMKQQNKQQKYENMNDNEMK